MKLIALTLIAAGALAAAGPIQAQAQTDTMTVHVDDLNLTSTRGAAIALQRVDQAARVFCDSDAWQGLARATASAKCRGEMKRKAVAQIGAPLVTALYEKTDLPLSLAAR
ncbi:UrcA family protein [Phenylobacterium sp.]|jgi:UrcA family protein|uniref:UrcA family protein n=1 Tax=Phenylobacterium sp. TaxID=1871053 RepID=UPI002E359A25|nr:UrcA family protein [Phenylobacterium sp.]HEX3365938.1 UrcA family protein [Phenylobacterium sp.]